MHFSSRLKIAIDHIGVTPYKIGKETSVSRELIGKYLTGKTEPSVKNILALAEYLNLSIEWLLTGRGKMLREPDGSDNKQDIAYEPPPVYENNYQKKYIKKLEEDNKRSLGLIEDMRTIIKDQQELIDAFTSRKIIFATDKNK